MKTLKTLLILIISSFILFSCKTEGCTDPQALNYNPEADVDDCSCVYPDPEPEPEPDIRDPYTGNYTVTDSLFMGGSFDSAKTYTLQISLENTVSDTIYLKNLWGNGASYFALLTDSSFNIPSQQVNGPYYTEGSGNISNGEITYQTSGDIYLHKGSGSKQ